MNERIEELYKQSFIEVQDENSFPCMTFSKQKFAELIVKECINIADKSNTGSKSSNEGTEFYYNADIGNKIKEHFGLHGMSTEDKKTLIKELLGVKNETNQ